jgi:hypothetical protein
MGNDTTDQDYSYGNGEQVQMSPERRKSDPAEATNNLLPDANQTSKEVNDLSLYEWIISERNKRLQRQKYILAALRTYGDLLNESLTDQALTPAERVSAMEDSQEVELLIKDTEARLEDMKRYGR